jgi:septum site-determining protein MinC
MSAPALGALFLPGSSGGGSHRLVLPPSGQAASPQELAVRALESAGLLQGPPRPGPVGLEANGWPLTARGLRALQELLLQHDLWLENVQSTNPHTLVAAAALGLEARPPWPGAASSSSPDSPMPGGRAGELVVHRGTVRSGDHLQAAGSLLVLGDVNPGARLSAGGHVLVWGRLRGLAHAGTGGDGGARIVALQLRPLQLRIAGAVARGPEEPPPEGLAEQARLVGGVIRLEPAPPQWPLNA